MGVKNFLIVLLVSMLPLIELRGAIPIAVGMDLPKLPSFIIAMIGNLLPMPFIFLFAQKLLEFGTKSRFKFIRKFCNFCIKKGTAGGKKLQGKSSRGYYLALLLFVGIPLPGTGAWTGTLAASFLRLNFKKSMIAVSCGVLLAGLIMMALSFGVFDLIIRR